MAKPRTSSFSKHVYATGFHGKFCTSCDQLVDIKLFGLRPANLDGLQSDCKSCRSIAENERSKDPEYRNRSKECTERYRLKRKYGISIEERDRLIESQNGLCAICKSTCRTGNKLSVDHSHVTGKVRGMLCANCNLGLGSFMDSISSLKSAVEYLEVFGG